MGSTLVLKHKKPFKFSLNSFQTIKNGDKPGRKTCPCLSPASFLESLKPSFWQVF
jgi:hypothetical protein